MNNILIAACFVGFFLASCNLKTAEEYYMLGLKNEEFDNYKKAYKYYSKAVKLKTDDPNYFIKRAEARARGWVRESNLSNVESAYNDLFTKFPWNEEGLYSRATYHYKIRGSTKIAKINLDSLISRYPKNIEGRILRGEIYLVKKDSTNANKDFDIALSLSKNKKDVYAQVGIINCNKKYYFNAIKSFNAAYKLNNGPIEGTCHYLSECFWLTNQKDSACYYFSKVNDEKNILQSSTFKQIREYCSKNR